MKLKSKLIFILVFLFIFINVAYASDNNMTELTADDGIGESSIDSLILKENSSVGQENSSNKSQPVISIDSTKVEKELGWKRTYNFEEGIKETINWYVNNQDWINNILNGDYKNAYKPLND